MVPICMMLMREMVTMPMSLITPPRMIVHRAVMVYMTWPVRTNKLTIPTFTMRHSHTVHIVMIVIPSVSMIMSMTVVGWR